MPRACWTQLSFTGGRVEGCEARSDKEEIGTKPVGQDVKEANYGVSCSRGRSKRSRTGTQWLLPSHIASDVVSSA